ncbi:uncharacterized protein LOC110231037 [Arabidopsis lyrata subsp. lyrata]|uniref:uncharacterized protein LOC110231037 n=1 Tax=Arabidopsis lyrata subsp. lyrata TaxID=81972 RepID=UPI000A29B321|nr:uncharacterized protein LOC110231037 [Arabidopsis lyrata subsp. lyrata]|eukprot:XP_020891386.1 uncharacterized protein LOC110231037 [Arabidopsis lyrata subsp. lyrata]
MSTFMLPKGCIRKIESLCSRFLWSGSIETHTKAKVAWSTCCLPMNEGGLGFKRFSVWNAKLCLRLIWLLFSNSGSLWVAWQHHHHKLDSYSFWEVKQKISDSWFWKVLLKLRGLARKFISCTIGSGTTAWFWHDNWTPFGSLINHLGDEGPRSLRIPLNARVSEACNRLGWVLAPPRSAQAVNLHIFLSTINLPSSSTAYDFFYFDDKPISKYSSSKTWEALRPRESAKDWADSVWFKGSTPRHAFNFWVANLDRISQPSTVFTSWSALLSWAKAGSVSSPYTLRLLLTHALVYNIWKQRNNLIHNQVEVPPLTIFRDIDHQIINSITARRTR